MSKALLYPTGGQFFKLPSIEQEPRPEHWSERMVYPRSPAHIGLNPLAAGISAHCAPGPTWRTFKHVPAETRLSSVHAPEVDPTGQYLNFMQDGRPVLSYPIIENDRVYCSHELEEHCIERRNGVTRHTVKRNGLWVDV